MLNPFKVRDYPVQTILESSFIIFWLHTTKA